MLPAKGMVKAEEARIDGERNQCLCNRGRSKVTKGLRHEELGELYVLLVKFQDVFGQPMLLPSERHLL